MIFFIHSTTICSVVAAVFPSMTQIFTWFRSMAWLNFPQNNAANEKTLEWAYEENTQRKQVQVAQNDLLDFKSRFGCKHRNTTHPTTQRQDRKAPHLMHTKH